MAHKMNQSQSQSQGVIDPPFLSQSRLGTMMMNPSRGAAQSRMMIRNYGLWPPPQTPVEAMIFQNVTKQQGYGVSKPRNWKGKDKRKPLKSGGRGTGGAAAAAVGVTGGYKPPNLNELKNQNRIKPRKFHPNKRNNRFAPYAPRNTTSFLIRAKRSGGIASLVSPCVATPAVLPTPIFSPSTELLGDTAKEEWGVECYGSMKGLIRLRSPGNEEEQVQEELEVEEGEGGGSSESDVEEHLEVERRLDQDLSRFEMVYPNYNGGDQHNVLENRVNDQDNHIAHLEEENLMLKERLFLMDRELGDVRRRLQFLERQKNPFVEMINEEEEEEVVVVVEEECGENEFVKEDEEEGEASVAENVVVDKLCEVRSIHVVEDEACMDTMALSQCEEEEEVAAAAAVVVEEQQFKDGAAAAAAVGALADNNIGRQ